MQWSKGPVCGILSDPAYADRDQRKALWDEVCNVFASHDGNSLQDKNEIGKL